MIKKPVIITNYSTAKSQLENEIDGLIVPMENKDCADQMVEIIQDVEKLRKISEACSKRDYSNKREVQKLYKLFEWKGGKENVEVKCDCSSVQSGTISKKMYRQYLRAKL